MGEVADADGDHGRGGGRGGAGDRGPSARWSVAWALRNLGRHDEALRRQRELRAELDWTGDVDPYVDEEIALLEHEQM